MATVSLSSSEGKWIMASAILASSMAFIDGSALNVVLPALQESLHATGTDLFWILNAYLLMLASLILLGGSLGDKLGYRKIFMMGIVIFMAGSAACGFAPDVQYLIAFRAFQGIGGALMIPGSLSIISASFSDKERGKAIGTWSAITTVVTVGGPIMGGALADAGLWRYIFFINIPIGVASIFILWFKVPEGTDENSDRTLDYPGAVTTVLGLALLTFGFLRIPATGFNNLVVYISLIAGVLLLVAFVIIEHKSKHPVMPLQLFLNKTFSGANLLTLFLYAGLTGAMLFLSLNMVQIQGYSQLQSGLTLLPFTILMITVARFAGALADKHGPRWLLIAGPAVAGTGMLLLSFVKQTTGPAEYWTSFFPGILAFGLGMSFTVAPLTAAVMGSVAHHFSGAASGINNAMARISGVFANAILGALAVLFFTASLQSQVKDLPLSPNTKQAVMDEAFNMGNATVPDSAPDKAAIKASYQKSFISAYQVIMQVCSGLAFLGAFISFLFIKNEMVQQQH